MTDKLPDSHDGQHATEPLGLRLSEQLGALVDKRREDRERVYELVCEAAQAARR